MGYLGCGRLALSLGLLIGGWGLAVAGGRQQDEAEGTGGGQGGKNAGPGAAEGAVAVSGGVGSSGAPHWLEVAHGGLLSDELPVAHEHSKQCASRYRGSSGFSPMLENAVPATS